jgi:hypothetical protein
MTDIEPCSSCGKLFDNNDDKIVHETEQHLSKDCGPHCGIQTTGGRVVHKRHHQCEQCHPHAPVS